MTSSHPATIQSTSACPCESGKIFAHCCEPYLAGKAIPATAVTLMRSRYCAYVISAEQYLLNSWHPSTRPAELDLGQSPLQWLGLKIRHTVAGESNDTEGSVEFIARCKHNGKAQRLHELSRFCKENGRWYYLDGKQL